MLLRQEPLNRIAILLGLLWCASTHSEGVLEVGRFSALAPGSVPTPWRPVGLHGKPPTQFTLVKDGRTVVVRAHSVAAVAALVRDLRVDPRHYPLIRWRWKVASLLQKGNLYRKDGDDYPARVYVTFDYDVNKLPWLTQAKLWLARTLYGEGVPVAALCYVWDNRAPVGTMVASAYTDQVRMIVVESGEGRLNRWVDEERNLYQDYRAAFGEEPPP